MGTFYDFVRTLPKQQDKGINNFIDFVKADKNFPTVNDPAILAIHLYLHLDPVTTTGFQKCMMNIPSNAPQSLSKKRVFKGKYGLKHHQPDRILTKCCC